MVCPLKLEAHSYHSTKISGQPIARLGASSPLGRGKETAYRSQGCESLDPRALVGVVYGGLRGLIHQASDKALEVLKAAAGNRGILLRELYTLDKTDCLLMDCRECR